MSISKLNSDLRTVFRYDAQITRIPCLPGEPNHTFNCKRSHTPEMNQGQERRTMHKPKD
jgi:hypothetical protein